MDMRKRLCKISQDEQELLLRGYIAIFKQRGYVYCNGRTSNE